MKMAYFFSLGIFFLAIEFLGRRASRSTAYGE